MFIVEVEGMLNKQPVSIIIDLGASLSYISPSVVEKNKFPLQKFENSWLVQLATSTKRKVTNCVERWELVMNGFPNQVKLNVLPLGSYDVLIGMDWLEKHRVMLNCFDKTFTCLNEKGETKNVK